MVLICSSSFCTTPFLFRWACYVLGQTFACAIVGITTMQCPFSKFTGVQNEEYQECSAVWALAMTILGDTNRKHSYKRVCIQGTKFISGSSVCRSVPMCRHGSENGASCMDCSTNFHTAGYRSIGLYRSRMKSAVKCGRSGEGFHMNSSWTRIVANVEMSTLMAEAEKGSM